MNRVVKFNQYGGPEVLSIETQDKVTELLAGEILVKMSAYALNRANVLFREGNYINEAQFPSRIGVEAVGVVEKIGEGVVNLAVGDRVNLVAPENESQSGYFADFNIVNQNNILPVPSSLTDVEASTCWVPFLTLYKNFVEADFVKQGSWVILPAASSSVSLAAHQLAKHLGAKTIGLTRTSAKVEQLKALGYDEIVVTQEENIEQRIKEITDGGADFAFDPVGGTDLTQVINSLKYGAELCVYGLLSGSTTELPIFPLMLSGVKVSCYTVLELFMDPERAKQAIDYFFPLFEQRKLLPIIDPQVFELSQVVDAFNYLESNQQIGKVVFSNSAT